MKNIFPFFCAALVLASCSHKQTSTGDERLKWNIATSVEAYEKVGHKDPKWDAQAKEVLMEFAKVRAGTVNEVETRMQLIGDAAEEAVKAGCDDPLVRYLYCRYQWGSPPKTREAWQNEFRQMAQSMAGSGYAPLRKFYANLRAANFLNESYKGDDKALWQEISQFRRTAMNDLAQSLEDKMLPIEEVVEACDALIGTISKNQNQLPDTYNLIEKPLAKNWPDASASYVIKAEFCFQLAWLARGNGYANQVSEDHWKIFFDRLKESEQALNKAWSLNPQDARIPSQMIKVAEGLQKERTEIEKWFERAMNLNTNNYDACSYKLHYLYPQWYGSREDMVEFGRQCVASSNWGGRVPLILVDAHYDFNRYLNKTEQEGYWRQSDVWPDIKSAYEKFFLLNPDATGYRSYYANYAYLCGQWENFIELIKVLSDGKEGVDTNFFGGEEQFNKMLALAKEQAANAVEPSK